MTLRIKLNLILLILTIIGIAVPAVISYKLQEKHTNEEALETAGIVMESALAVRKYTVSQIRPLLNEIDSWETEIINNFRKTDEKEEVGIKETNKGKFLYISRPIKITNPNCLACHSVPEAAQLLYH